MSPLIIHGAPFFIAALIFSVIYFTIRERAALREFIQAGRVELIALAAIIILSWAVRQYWVYHTHNVYFDEFLHLELAENLRHTGRFGETIVAGDHDTRIRRAPKWPPAFHSLLAAGFVLAGEREETAYGLNAILGALGVMAAWFFVRSLGFRGSTALIASLLVSAWPLHLRMSGGTSMEPGAMAAVLLASGLCVSFVKTRNDGLFLAGGAAVGLAGTFRLESVASALAVPVILGALEEWRRGNPFKFERKHYLWLGLFLLPAVMQALAGFGAYSSFRQKAPGVPLLGGMSFWMGGDLLPLAYPALILMGAAVLVKKRPALLAGLFANMLGMLLVYAFYINVDSSRYDLQRYQLLLAPGLAGFMAAAIDWAGGFKRKYSPVLVALSLAAAALIIPGIPNAQKPFRAESEREYRFLLEMKDKLPKDALYFAAFPSAISTTIGARCAPTDMLLRPDPKTPLDFSKGRIYFSDIGPLTSPYFKEMEEEVKKKYSLKPIAETETQKGMIVFFEISD